MAVRLRYKILITVTVVFMAVIGIVSYIWLNAEKYFLPMFIPPEAYWVDDNKPLRQQVRRIEVAGVLMEIPKMYLYSRLDPGVKQGGALLRVVWPEMRALHELKDRAEYEKILEEKRTGLILLEPRERKTPLNGMIENRKRLAKEEDEISSDIGLEGFIHYMGSFENREPWAEVYVERYPDGNVKSYISCSVNVPVPGCSHRFMRGSLYYQISYNKEVFFKDWRAQQQRAIDFIEGFKIINSSENKQP